MKQARQIDYFGELFNQDGNELFLLSLNGDTHTMSLNTVKQYCITDLVTGGTYNSSTGVVTFTNVNGGMFSVSGFKTDDITLTGGTYSNGTATFTNNTGGTFNVDGFFTGSTALSDLGFSISALPTKIIYQNVSLPENSYITYNSPLVVAGGYNLTIPSSTILQVIEQVGSESNVNNISDAIYTVNKNLNANNTSTATTSVMVYGVNVFTGVTPTNFATKLPQPVTGKSVKVINNGSTLLHIFPSNIGGRINNLPIDNAAVIPPDGNLYEFICIENPLPGEWTFSAPATGQYDSGEISVSISALTIDGVYNPIVSAYDSTRVFTTYQFNSANWGYNGKNKSNLIINNLGSGKYSVAFRPDTPWNGISKIKVYTNLITNIATGTQIRLLAGGESGYYSPFDSTILNSAVVSDNNELFVFNLNKKISGTAVPSSTIYTSANIGDAGTIWNEKVAYSDQYNSDVNLGGDGGTFIGNKSLGTASYPYSQTWDNTGNEINTGDIVDKYYSSFISFQILPFSEDFNYGVIPDFKFRFIIEYYQ